MTVPAIVAGYFLVCGAAVYYSRAYPAVFFPLSHAYTVVFFSTLSL